MRPQNSLRACASPRQGWLRPHTLNIERSPLNIRSLDYATTDVSNRCGYRSVGFTGKILLAHTVVIEKHCRSCFQHPLTATRSN